jgi:ketosteroid isomerase-like protein
MSGDPTSCGHVERARQAFEALTRGDVQSVLDQYSPDAVFDTAGYGMGTFEGREAIRGFLTEWSSSFEDLTLEADEILGLGGGVVLSIYHQEGRPLGATHYVRVRSATISEWLGEVIVRVTIYSDIDEARAAAERLAGSRSA